MNRYIGIDLGTSSVKLLLLSENGIEKTVGRDYPVSYPAPNYSEQNPADWYEQTVSALHELLEDTDRKSIKAIGFSGQMHGLVMLDRHDKVIRPAILWNDGRAVKEVDYLNNGIGKDFLLKHTGNIAFAGFTAPKLLWVKNNEPENFSRISKIMLPKDYLAYRLSGEFATDVSDASGTLYFDVSNRKWSEKMLEIIGIDREMLPVVYESREAVGNIKSELANAFGLNKDVKNCYRRRRQCLRGGRHRRRERRGMQYFPRNVGGRFLWKRAVTIMTKTAPFTPFARRAENTITSPVFFRRQAVRNGGLKIF